MAAIDGINKRSGKRPKDSDDSASKKKRQLSIDETLAEGDHFTQQLGRQLWMR